MKNIFYSICAVLLVLYFVGCNNASEVITASIESQAKSIGQIHNDGLDFIFSQVQLLEQENPSLRASVAPVMTSVQLATITRDYLQTTPNFTTVITRTHIEQVAADLDKIMANFTKEGIQSNWNSVKNDPSFKRITLSTTEQKAFADAEQIFLNLSNSNLSVQQQYDYIQANVAKIKTAYSVTILNQSELISGLLSIMDSSNEYWYKQEPLIPYNPVVVQADCFGYLVGWIRAFGNDQGRYSTQKEFSAHSGDRIREGLYAALAASGGRIIVKYF
jgi:hypothetical protein